MTIPSRLHPATHPHTHRPPAAWVARQLAEGQPPASPVTGLPLEHGAAVPNRLAAHLVAALQERGLLAAGADADAELEQLLGGLLASPRAPA